MRYDNVEIGTSDFDTLIETAKGNGICVDPSIYLDNLPDREGWHKVNKALGLKEESVDLYYTDPTRTAGKPQWVRGCNKVGELHPTIKRKWPDIILQKKVECITWPILFKRYEITEIGLLKIDTEGMDYELLQEYFRLDLPFPDKIIYEDNILTDQRDRIRLRELLEQHYKMGKRGFNMICKLR